MLFVITLVVAPRTHGRHSSAYISKKMDHVSTKLIKCCNFHMEITTFGPYVEPIWCV